MKSNSKKAVIKDVADMANVSVGSVSNYLNNVGNLKSTTKKRIEAAIEQLQYKPNQLARSMRTGKSNSISIIVPDITNPFFAEIYDAIKDSSIKNNLVPVLYTANNELDILKNHFINQSIQHSDGIILCFVDDDESLAELIDNTQHIPIIMISWNITNPKFNCINIDVVKGTIKATNHLICLGHKRIGYIGGLDRVSKEKQKGFCTALENSNLKVYNEMEYHGDFCLQTGFDAASKFTKFTNGPTAVFAENDILAIGFIKYCLQNQIKIPDDIAVIGFDNIKLASMYEPALSTISMPIKKIGEEAVNLFLSAQNKEKLIKNISLDSELVVRNSTDKTASTSYLD